jgi:hypothetical protein
MNAEFWYWVVNFIPLPCCGLMMLAPQARLTRRMTGNYAIFGGLKPPDTTHFVTKL